MYIEKKEPTPEQQLASITNKLRDIMIKFAGQSDTALILKGYNSINADEMLRLLESSLHAQREELLRLKSTARRTARNLDKIAQQQLI